MQSFKAPPRHVLLDNTQKLKVILTKKNHIINKLYCHFHINHHRKCIMMDFITLKFCDPLKSSSDNH